ncbi:MAG TPA: ZIP family metal transporter [Burkholderiales bacterium]|nr:ZIP family metal transporter [Burkholderiales bacterium]
MSTLGYIVAAAVIGGVLSLVCAAIVSFSVRQNWINPLISFAIGALLGAAFLDILPHALESSGAHTVAGTVLAGILGFFILEKLVLWRHCHLEDCEVHDPPALGVAPNAHNHAHGHSHGHAHDDRGRSGLMILIGDSFHNFVDGVLIAAAFMQSPALGVVTATAVIAHEVPQEVGDFLILLHSGYSKARAFALNLLSSLAMLVGALLAYFALQIVQGAVDILLALAAASMIYVAVADLIPGLHKRPELRATAQQVVLILLGIFTVWAVGEISHATMHADHEPVAIHAPVHEH